MYSSHSLRALRRVPSVLEVSSSLLTHGLTLAVCLCPQLKERQEEFMKNVKEREARGESFAQFKEMWAMMKREQERAK